MPDFEAEYVSTNNRVGAIPYDQEFFAKLLSKLSERDETLKPIAPVVLAALSIGAHRADIVPNLFNEAINDESDEAVVLKVFNQFRAALMIVWPFVGIPWCVPACLGLVNALKSKGLEHLAKGRTRHDMGSEDAETGLALLEKTYSKVDNREVREMLLTYFADFSTLTWSVIFGYSLAGTTRTGVFEERHTQLIVASAIMASGATRQARSHLKASIALGNSTEAVRSVYDVAILLSGRDQVSLKPIDIDTIAEEVSNA